MRNRGEAERLVETAPCRVAVVSAWSCWTGPGARARGHLAHHHAVALSLGPVVGEALALVHRARAVVEERRVLLADTTGVVGVALDPTSAGSGDQVDGSAQGDRRQAPTAKAAPDQDARTR